MSRESILDFLKAKNYIINIAASEKSLTVDFPERKFGLHLSAYSLEYKPLRNGFRIVGDNVDYTLKCPSYAREIIVSYDIILRSQALMYDEKLIDFAPVERLKLCNKNEENKRDALLLFINKYVFNGVATDLESDDLLDMADQEEIKEGYLQLIRFMRNGILYDTHLVKELAA